MLSGRALLLPDERNGLKASQLRHLHIDQGEIEVLLLQPGQSIPAIVRRDRFVSLLFEQPDHQRLVDAVVVSHQGAHGPPRFAQRVTSNQAGRRSPRGLSAEDLQAENLQAKNLQAENLQDGLPQLRLADRLRQISQDAQLAATGGVASQTGGSQHHDHGARQLGILFDLLRQREAVHTRHVRIGQDQGEGLSRAARSVERRQRHLSVFHRLRFHAPARKQVYQGSPGGLIIIHNQHARPLIHAQAVAVAILVIGI